MEARLFGWLEALTAVDRFSSDPILRAHGKCINYEGSLLLCKLYKLERKKKLLRPFEAFNSQAHYIFLFLPMLLLKTFITVSFYLLYVSSVG